MSSVDQGARFSLVITTRDRREDLLRTLGVMVPLLLPRHEVIVFDDGSGDGTADAVRTHFPEVRLLHVDQSIGLMAARNRLHEEATGDFALTLDDDAELIGGRRALDRIVAHFERHPSCACIALRVFWGEVLPAGADDAPDCQEAPRTVQEFVGCGHVWRLAAWRRIRPYPAWLRMYAEERFAALELARHRLDIDYLPSVLVHHRVVPSSRPAGELAWRYRTQLRSGLLVQGMFLPFGPLLRRTLYAYRSQIRRRLLGERRWRTVGDLVWVSSQLVRHAPRVWREREPLDGPRWRRWRDLPPPVIYWRPRAAERPDPNEP